RQGRHPHALHGAAPLPPRLARPGCGSLHQGREELLPGGHLQGEGRFVEDLAGPGPLYFRTWRRRATSTGTWLEWRALLWYAARRAASSREARGGSSAVVRRRTWAPGSCRTWNHHSSGLARSMVILSFSRWLRPTRTSRPSLDRYRKSPRPLSPARELFRPVAPLEPARPAGGRYPWRSISSASSSRACSVSAASRWKARLSR